MTDAKHAAATEEVVRSVYATLRGYGVQEPEATDAVRFMRSALHGFVMGTHVWRDEADWPIPRTRPTPWYLASVGHANTLDGDGTFAPEPRASPPDRYIYAPANPAPTWGGSSLGVTELAVPRDQRWIERRGDVLAYTSAPLGEDLDVTGL